LLCMRNPHRAPELLLKQAGLSGAYTIRVSKPALDR
jgi:hypothetical protein